MQLGAVIDTVIGVAFVFFLLALASSAAAEWVATLLKKRAKYLLRTLRDMLDGPAVVAGPGNALPAGVDAAWTDQGTARRWEKAMHEQALRLMSEGERGRQHLAAAVQVGVRTAEQANEWVKRVERTTPGAAMVRQAADTSVDRVLADAAKEHPAVPVMLRYLLTHPLVTAQAQSRASGVITRLPSYLSARTVSTVLLDALVPDGNGRTSVGRLRARIAQAKLPPELERTLLSVTQRADATVDDARTEIETWYDTTMERVSGNYKRWTKRWLLVISAVIVLVVHVDALAMAKTLYTDESVRAGVVALAEQNACQDAADVRVCAETTRKDLTRAGLPIGPSADCRLDIWTDKGGKQTRDVGWKDAATCLVGGPAKDVGPASFLLALLGMALSVLAASFGAPFWFDVLTRASNLRNTGRKPDPSTTS